MPYSARPLRHSSRLVTLTGFGLLSLNVLAPVHGQSSAPGFDPNNIVPKRNLAKASLPTLSTRAATQVEHKRQITIQGKQFTFLKLNYGNDRFAESICDAAGVQYSADYIDKLYAESVVAYGKIHPTLYHTLKRRPNQPVEVMLWLQVPSPSEIERPREITKGSELAVAEKLESQHRENLTRFTRVKAKAIAALGLPKQAIIEDLEESPFVISKLTRDELKKIIERPELYMAMLYEAEGFEDLASSMAISNADDVQAAGNTGSGTKVAVWEGSPADTTNLNIEDSYSSFAGITPSTSNHAQNVSAIINNTTAQSGYAPDSRFFSADSTSLAALNWAIDRMRVSTMNQSFHRAAEIGDGLQSDDIYKDYKVLHYPWPTIVHAAGNWCPSGSSCFEGGADVTDEFVNHKGYNTISIANHTDNAANMVASSNFVNPTSRRNDRELPELSANGNSVTADGITMTGTSQASPAVTGSVALLQAENTVLRYWPEANRALLFAGASRNVATHNGTLSGGGAAANAPNTWWRDVSLGNDGFDGAGALDVEASVRIVQNRWSGAASQRGWDIGYLRPADFNSSGNYAREYKISVPRNAEQRHMKVALAWNSTAFKLFPPLFEIYLSFLNLDLDLRVFDAAGNQVAFSVSWDNSYEIVDFDAQPGQTYTVKINRWASSSNRQAESWFAIAWDLQQ